MGCRNEPSSRKILEDPCFHPSFDSDTCALRFFLFNSSLFSPGRRKAEQKGIIMFCYLLCKASEMIGGDEKKSIKLCQIDLLEIEVFLWLCSDFAIKM